MTSLLTLCKVHNLWAEWHFRYFFQKEWRFCLSTETPTNQQTETYKYNTKECTCLSNQSKKQLIKKTLLEFLIRLIERNGSKDPSADSAQDGEI